MLANWVSATGRTFFTSSRNSSWKCGYLLFQWVSSLFPLEISATSSPRNKALATSVVQFPKRCNFILIKVFFPRDGVQSHCTLQVTSFLLAKSWEGPQKVERLTASLSLLSLANYLLPNSAGKVWLFLLLTYQIKLSLKVGNPQNSPMPFDMGQSLVGGEDISTNISILFSS